MNDGRLGETFVSWTQSYSPIADPPYTEATRQGLGRGPQNEADAKVTAIGGWIVCFLPC